VPWPQRAVWAAVVGPAEDQGRQAKDTNEVDDGQQCAEAAASP
jgi:hypothetical protein